MHRQCLSVTIRRMCDEETLGRRRNEWYPRDAAMVDVAKELGYDLSGTTTVMTREKLMAADAVIVFDERHRDAITRVLDYSYWNKIVLFNKMAFDEDGNVFVNDW